MANRPAPHWRCVRVTVSELVRLTRATRSGRVAQRARIVLLAADGVSNTAIAERVGCRGRR